LPEEFTHGFLVVEGSFITIDVPGASSTQPFGINPWGDIVGQYSVGGINHGFLLHEDTFTTIDVPGASSTGAFGIIESDGFAHVLWDAATSAFSLERWVAEKKFGPHFVIAKTPIDNIRLTTFFAGEAEVRVVDRSRIRVLESIDCTVAT
jgi:hypothetical protein